MEYPDNASISISIVFGPWAGHDARYFELANQRDRAAAATADVLKVVPVQGVMRHLSMSADDDKLLTVDGPGVGKTSKLMTSCMKHAVDDEAGTRALLLAPLKNMRNNLCSLAVYAGFRKYVRVVCTSGLDSLSKKITPGAPVWQRMERRY